MPDPTTVYDVTAFCRNPMAVSFKGVNIGGTDGAPSITPNIETDDVTCNQAQGRAVKKVVKKFTFKITCQFKEIKKALLNTFGFGAGISITSAVIGTDLYAQAGELILSEVENDVIKTGGIVFTFPSVIGKITKFDPDGEKDQVVEVEFETKENASTILTVSGVAAAQQAGG